MDDKNLSEYSETKIVDAKEQKIPRKLWDE